MKNLVVIVGLPGSGKTTFVEKNFCNYVLFDDVGINPELFEKLKNWKKYPEYENKLLVITDIFSCDPDYREIVKNILLSSDLEPSWIFFSNDPEQCFKNVQSRGNWIDKRVSKKYIYSLSENYVIPKYAIVLPVYRGEE